MSSWSVNKWHFGVFSCHVTWRCRPSTPTEPICLAYQGSGCHSRRHEFSIASGVCRSCPSLLVIGEPSFIASCANNFIQWSWEHLRFLYGHFMCSYIILGSLAIQIIRKFNYSTSPAVLQKCSLFLSYRSCIGPRLARANPWQVCGSLVLLSQFHVLETLKNRW